MALQRVAPQVVIQPSGGFPVAQYGMDQQMAAKGWGQIGDTMSTLHDVVQRDYDKDAVRQAQLDAPAMFKKDGTGQIIPPASFDPPGMFSSRAYREAYRDAGYNHYSVSVERDFENHSQQVLASYPTDLAAAQKKLQEKRDSVVAGLDPQYAPLLTLKLNSMSGRVESQINANVIGQQHKVAEADGKWAYDNVVLQAGRLAKTPDNFDPDVLQANNTVLANEVRRATGLFKQAGYSDAAIGKMWADARVKTEIARDEQMIRNSVMQSKNYSVEGMAAWQQGLRAQIEQRRIELGPDGPAYIAAMAPALAWAMTGTQLEAQKQDGKQMTVDLRDKAMAEGMLKGTVGGELGLSTDQIMRGITQARNAVYNDPSLSTAQQIRRLGMYDSVLQQGTADFTQYSTQKITQLVTQASSVETPVERQKAMVNELRQIVADPNTAAYLPSGVRDYAARAVSGFAANEARADFGTFHGLSLGGHVTPDDVRQRGQQMYAKGLIGDGPGSFMRPDAWAAFQMQAEAAYTKRQASSATAQQVISNAAKGIPPDASQQSTIGEIPEMQFSNGGQPYDVKQNDSRLNAAAHLHQVMTIPEAVKNQLTAIPLAGAPEQALAGAEQLSLFKKVLMNKDGFTEERALGFIRSQLGGKTTDFLFLTKRWGDPDIALQIMKADTNSESQNLGVNQNTAVENISKTVDQVASEIPKMASISTISHVTSPYRPIDAANQWARTMMGDKAPGLAATLWNDIGVTRQNQIVGQFQSISIAPDLRNEWIAGAVGIAKREGDLIDKAHGNVKDPKKIAVMQAGEALRDKTELVADPADPTKGIIQWKSAHTRIGNMLQQGPVSADAVRGYSIALVEKQQELERSMGIEKMLPNYKRETVNMVPYQASDGSFSWKIRAELSTGVGQIDLMTMKDDDPRLGALAGDVTKQAAADLRKHWFGITPKPDTLNESWWAGRVVGHLMSGLDSTGKSLFSDYKLGQYKEALLQDMGGPADRTPIVARGIDAVFGRDRDPNRWPAKTIDWEKTKKAMADTKDEILRERAANLAFMSNIRQRAPQAPKPTVTAPPIP